MLQYNLPIEELVERLRKFAWDSDESLVVLTRQHIAAVSARYLRGELTANQLEAWANAIEGREDIGFESGHEHILQEVIHQLANPLLTKPITNGTVQNLVKSLK